MVRKKRHLYNNPKVDRRIDGLAPSAARQEILNYIIEFGSDHGYSPTVREITTHVGLLSTSTTHKYINQLVQEGRVERDSKLSRTLRVVV